MNDKKVMPEDIDYGLVEQIYKGIENDVPTSSLYREDIQTIRATLAYLANNPLELTEKVDASLVDFIWDHHKYIQEWQRIAYLKKEDPLPEELRSLMTNPFDKASFTECFNERILAAYKLGKGLK